MYYDNLIIVTLIEKNQVITYTKKKTNFFMLDLAISSQIILVKANKKIKIIPGQSFPTYLVS